MIKEVKLIKPVQLIMPVTEIPPIEKDKRNLAAVDLFSLFATDNRKKSGRCYPKAGNGETQFQGLRFYKIL